MSAEQEFRRAIDALATWEEVAAHVEAVVADVHHPHWFAAMDYAARIAFGEDDETPAEEPEPDTNLALDLGKSARARPRRRPRRERP